MGDWGAEPGMSVSSLTARKKGRRNTYPHLDSVRPREEFPWDEKRHSEYFRGFQPVSLIVCLEWRGEKSVVCDLKSDRTRKGKKNRTGEGLEEFIFALFAEGI
jgi:hypothetical protein